MSDEFRNHIVNSPGLRQAIQRQGYLGEQQKQWEENMRAIEESSQEIEARRETEDFRNQEHLEASQITASRLHDVTKALRDVTDALEDVHSRMDNQAAESKVESEKNRRATWWSFGAGALAAVAAIGVPFIVLWIQSGG